MAFQKNKSKGNSARLTGLFKTKKRGLWTGTAKEEQIDALIAKIKEAKKSGNGIVFFLWRNDDEEGGPQFSLSANVATPYEGKRGKRIEPDDDFGDGEPEGDSLFD